jgi:hypothetical protein
LELALGAQQLASSVAARIEPPLQPCLEEQPAFLQGGLERFPV